MSTASSAGGAAAAALVVRPPFGVTAKRVGP